MDDQRPWPADKVERWGIERLIPYAKNARVHTDAQVAAIAASNSPRRDRLRRGGFDSETSFLRSKGIRPHNLTGWRSTAAGRRTARRSPVVAWVVSHFEIFLISAAIRLVLCAASFRLESTRKRVPLGINMRIYVIYRDPVVGQRAFAPAWDWRGHRND